MTDRSKARYRCGSSVLFSCLLVCDMLAMWPPSQLPTSLPVMNRCLKLSVSFVLIDQIDDFVG